MAYKDLQAFMKALEKKELLDVVDTCVDSELEITEIADRVSKKNGRALLFNKVKNSPYPVLINAVGSYERLHMAFEVEDLDDIAHEISELVNMGNYLDIMSQIKSIPRLTRMLHVFPKKVKKSHMSRSHRRTGS